MAINDDEMLEDFTRMRLEGAEQVLEVAVISWRQGPHMPETSWVEVQRFAAEAPQAVVARSRRALLQRKRYFKLCSMCRERNPSGWMSEPRVCQGCAERYLGVVH